CLTSSTSCGSWGCSNHVQRRGRVAWRSRTRRDVRGLSRPSLPSAEVTASICVRIRATDARPAAAGAAAGMRRASGRADDRGGPRQRSVGIYAGARAMRANGRPRRNILLVEDDAAVATMLTDGLGARGYNVQAVPTAAAAET